LASAARRIAPVLSRHNVLPPYLDAKRFIEEVRGDDPDLASYLRIEERELEAGGMN